MSTDEMRDYEDQDPHSPPTSTAKLGPYASFLQFFKLSDMTREEFDKALKEIPLPTPGPLPPEILFHAAIEASSTNRYTDIISDVAYDIVPYI